MSGLALLSGYGSDSDDDGQKPESNVAKMGDDNNSDSTRIVTDKGFKKGLLPSAMDLLNDIPGIKRKLPCSDGHSYNGSGKISRVITNKFVPPQVRSERPNVVTEDMKHK